MDTERAERTEVTGELSDLRRRVDELTRRVAALEAGERPARAAEPPPAAVDEEELSVWSWVGRSKVLPRVATVCFVLVIALVLRTLTDEGLIHRQLGVVLGMAYAASLVAWGWRALSRRGYGRRVFPACGVVLMCTIVMETQTRFRSISPQLANLVLIGTLLAVALLGVRYRTGTIIGIAAVSVAVATLALGFPELLFPYAAGAFLVANLAAHAAARLRHHRWQQWVVFGLTLFFWLLWTFKLYAPLSRGEAVPPDLYLPWFVPALVVFAATYVVLAARLVGRDPQSPDVFGVLLPTTNLCWAYPAAAAVVIPWTADARWLGAAGVVAAAIHLGLSFRLWRRVRSCAPGITAFVCAGTLLFAPAISLAAGDLLAALPIWAVAAFGLAVISTVCGSAGVRLLSYLLQSAACVAGIATGAFSTAAPSMLASGLVAAVLTAASVLHYSWCRARPPAPDTWYARIDPAGRAGIVVLWIATAAGFCTLRLATHAALSALPIEVENAFQGAQSVMLNLIAIGLMVLGLRRRSRQLLATAVLVAVVAGLKVFAADLFTVRGVPLVLSVFSFGVAAAVGSVVLGRWQRGGGGEVRKAEAG